MGEIILKIGGELAERLRARAAAAGQGVEEYALGILWHALEQPGFEEDGVPFHANTYVIQYRARSDRLTVARVFHSLEDR